MVTNQISDVKQNRFFEPRQCKALTLDLGVFYVKLDRVYDCCLSLNAYVDTKGYLRPTLEKLSVHQMTNEKKNYDTSILRLHEYEHSQHLL